MTVDYTPLVNLAVQIAAAALAALFAQVGYWMVRKLKLERDTVLNQRVGAAAEAAAGLAYSYMAQNAAGRHVVDVKSVAVAEGVTYVMTGMASILTELGLTPERIGQMVEARLGKLLAADPTVFIPPFNPPVEVKP